MRESRGFRIAFIVCLTATAMFSQVTTSTMQGVVRDPSGAAVPGAFITLTNVQTGAVFNWRSGADGHYVATLLPPGEYEVSVQKPEFQQTIPIHVQLKAAHNRRIDVTIKIDSQVITTITRDDRPITELPLATPTSRNVLMLVALMPGVIQTNSVAVFDAPQGNSGFSFNGQRDSANNYTIDGADNNQPLLGAGGMLPAPEAISELRIQNYGFAAELGRTGGGVIQLITRSGTSDFHGSVYEFLRNDSLDARGPFDRVELPPLRQNEFGAALGGPLQRNRTFFFVDYSGFRQRAGQSPIASVPTLNQRNGIYVAGEGAGTVYDSAAGAPFPGNTIPAARQSPVGKKLLELYPLPNLPGRVVAGSGIASNYTGAVVQQQDATRGDIRLDRSGSRNSFFARYSIFDGFLALPPLFGSRATGDLPVHAGKGNARNQSFVFSDTHAFSANRSNEFRASFARAANSFAGYDAGQNVAAEIGIPNINVFGPVSSGLPRIDITGMNSLGTDAPIPSLRYETSFQLADNFTLLRGRHQMKFGADIRRVRADWLQSPLESPRGHFLFDPNYTSNNGAPGTGLAAASVLLGFPAAAARGILSTFPSSRVLQTFFFAQDEVKLSHRLTLNFGIRYERYPPVVDRWDNQTNFDLRSGRMQLAARAGNSRTLVRPDNNNWAPRIGIAFALQPRTTIRAGYGVSYSPDRLATLNNSYPFASVQQIIPPDRFRPTPALSIANGIELPARPDVAAESLPLVGAATYLDPNYKTGYVQVWNVSVQHQLTSNLTADVAYIRLRGTHLFGNNHVNLNQPDPGPGAINNRRPYAGVAPLATNILLRDSSEWSFYRGLQARAQKRFTYGLWLLWSYTWATATDDAAVSYNTHDWDSVARGPANTDFRHLTAISALYDLPVGKGHKYFGGWQVNSIYTFRTGLPATATLSAALVASTVNTGGAGRPDQVDTARLPKGKRTLTQYFNVAAFVAPAVNSFRYGSATRNSIRGPSYSSLDLSLFKNLRFGERLDVQIRGEVFNVANHPNWGQPGTTFGTTTFGAITSLAANSTMRQVQLGLKLLF